MDLVTLQQAREHIRSDSSDDDGDLALKISAASSAVLGYITASIWEPLRDEDGRPVVDADGKEKPFLDDEGKKVVRSVIRQATLVTVAWMYAERDGSQKYKVSDQDGYGYPLPQAATALLYQLRRPTTA